VGCSDAARTITVAADLGQRKGAILWPGISVRNAAMALNQNAMTMVVTDPRTSELPLKDAKATMSAAVDDAVRFQAYVITRHQRPAARIPRMKKDSLGYHPSAVF